MIKQITQTIFEDTSDMLYCDYCGEGMERTLDNTKEVLAFVSLHTDCTKARNKNLNFLKKAAQLKL